MKTVAGRVAFCVAAMLVALTCAAADSKDPTVVVSYRDGQTVVEPASNGAHFFSDKPFPLAELPYEVGKLSFTQRPSGTNSPVTVDAPAGATVYVLIDSEKGINAKSAGVGALNTKLAQSGWTRLADAHWMVRQRRVGQRQQLLAIYKQTFSSAKKLDFPATGVSGVVIAAKSLEVKASGDVPKVGNMPAKAKAVNKPAAEPEEGVTPIARRQSSIKALYVAVEGSGRMLGLASDLIITATPGKARNDVPVSFTTHAGGEMHLVLEDVLRSIRVTYPKWEASKVELSFEDKYSPKDGGSIGTAVGTLLLSVLEGFEIDSKAAITGDVSADGKLRRIGGLAAKIRAASQAGCRVVIVPPENYEQLADAMVYDGVDEVARIQVIGASSLNEASEIARVDREAKLKAALDAFDQVQVALKANANAIRSPDVVSKLRSVLEQAPNHLSAKLLLAVAERKGPDKLTSAASMYYAFMALRTVEPALFERGTSQNRQATPPVVQEALKGLQKLRRVSDPKVVPLVDACRQYITTLGEATSGRTSAQSLEVRRQQVLDAMQRLEADRDLMEKMLKQGV